MPRPRSSLGWSGRQGGPVQGGPAKTRPYHDLGQGPGMTGERSILRFGAKWVDTGSPEDRRARAMAETPAGLYWTDRAAKARWPHYWYRMGRTLAKYEHVRPRKETLCGLIGAWRANAHAGRRSEHRYEMGQAQRASPALRRDPADIMRRIRARAHPNAERNWACFSDKLCSARSDGAWPGGSGGWGQLSQGGRKAAAVETAPTPPGAGKPGTDTAEDRHRHRHRQGIGRRGRMRQRRAEFEELRRQAPGQQSTRQHKPRPARQEQRQHKRGIKHKQQQQHRNKKQQQQQVHGRRRTRWALMWLGLLVSSCPDSKGVGLTEVHLQAAQQGDRQTGRRKKHRRVHTGRLQAGGMGKRGEVSVKVMVGTSEQEPD